MRLRMLPFGNSRKRRRPRFKAISERADNAGRQSATPASRQRRGDVTDAFAQSILGTIYANGFDVPRDDVQANFWFDLAVTHFPASEIEKREKPVEDRDPIAAG